MAFAHFPGFAFMSVRIGHHADLSALSGSLDADWIAQALATTGIPSSSQRSAEGRLLEACKAQGGAVELGGNCAEKGSPGRLNIQSATPNWFSHCTYFLQFTIHAEVFFTTIAVASVRHWEDAYGLRSGNR